MIFIMNLSVVISHFFLFYLQNYWSEEPLIMIYTIAKI